MLSFRNRLLILLTGLVVGAQIVTLFTVLATTLAEERKRAAAELVAGAQNALRALGNRERQLASAVTVLVGDYGLREAVALGDGPTLVTVLDNHGARIGAELTVALDPAGNLLAHGSSAPLEDADLLQALRELPTDGEQRAAFVVTDAGLYQVFAAPVMAPDEVGRVVLGFAVNNRLASELGEETGVEVAFLKGAAGGFRFAASSTALMPSATQSLAAELRESPQVVDIGGAEYLAAATHLSTGEPPLDVALLKSMDQVMAPFHRLAWILGTIFGVTLLAAVVAGLQLGRSAARPVQRLAAGAGRVATGDYSQPVESSGGRELANLARAFNSMQSGIAEREARLRHMAMHDAATGLPNRAHLEQWLDERLSLARADVPLDAQTAVVQLVVTNLPEISATLGFALAERLIGHIAWQLREADLEQGLAARLGGAEFAVASRIDDAAAAMALAERLRTCCQRPLVTDGVTLQAGVVLGVAIAPRDATAAAEALRCAHAAVESAQHAGIAIGTFEQATDEAQRRRLTLGADLPGAIESGQLYLLYQPKQRQHDGRISGVESLVRWKHPVLGQVSPAEFIPIAERTGASARLTRWVLRTALEQLSHWHREGLNLHMAVNFSATDLLDQHLLQEILGGLRDFGLPAGSLTIEITESVLLRDPQAVRRNIELLRVAGVRFSVDDFGTGYSSLSQLRDLAVDELKIDQSFVRSALRGPEDAALLRAIVEMAHGLGLRTVAEGVESEAQRELLAGLGCDYAQGYLISRPAPAEELAPLLRTSGERRERASTAIVRELRRRES